VSLKRLFECVDAVCISDGKLFHAVGPATQNARLPRRSLVWGTMKSPRDADLAACQFLNTHWILTCCLFILVTDKFMQNMANVWVTHVSLFITDCSLEMMDKVEPPPVADGYGLSVAFVCMLEIVRSIESLVQPVADSTSSSSPDVPLPKPTAESVSTSDGGITLIILVAEAFLVILFPFYA